MKERLETLLVVTPLKKGGTPGPKSLVNPANVTIFAPSEGGNWTVIRFVNGSTIMVAERMTDLVPGFDLGEPPAESKPDKLPVQLELPGTEPPKMATSDLLK
jgi:FtsP/CotA-like multicopper oxidase with cupredoxin domain